MVTNDGTKHKRSGLVAPDVQVTNLNDGVTAILAQEPPGRANAR